MTKSVKRLALYLSVVLPVTIITVTLRTIALFLYLDKGLIYFTSETLLTATVAITLAFCIFSISYLFIPEQKIFPASSFINPVTYIPSGLTAIALLFVGSELFLSLSLSEHTKFSSDVSLAHIVTALAAIFAFVGTVNFFLNVFYEKRQSRSRAAFCMCAVIFFALYSAHLFFSTKLPINSPNKAIDQTAIISLSIFFLYETRISLDRPAWKPYVTFGMISASLSLLSSVPAIIFYFANDGAVISESIAENVLVLVLAIYVLSRLYLVLTSAPDETCSTALAIEKMAKVREEEIIYSKQEAESKGTEEIPQETHNSEPIPGSNYEIDITVLTNFTEESSIEDKE